MKLRKILALALTLCVAASLMAPMASAVAAPYEAQYGSNAKVAPITLTANAIEQSNGTYNVTVNATMSMSAETAKFFADLYNENIDKKDDLKFNLTLTGDSVAKVVNTDTFTTTQDMIYERVGNTIETGTKILPETDPNSKNSMKLIYKVKDGVTVSETNLQNTVTFTATKTGVAAADVTPYSGSALYANIEVFLTDQYAERIAYGTANFNVTPYSSSDDDSGSGGGSGTPSTPSTGTISYDTEDTSVTDESAPQTLEQAANAAKAKEVLRNNVSKKSTNANDKTYTINETAIAKELSDNHLSYKGTKVIDKATGKEIEVDANGNFVMPAGGVDIVVEYESVPYTPEESGVNSLLNTKDHIAYTQGDAMGKWNPDKNITRAEAATMIYRLLINQNVEKTVSFTDVPEGKWYTEPVLVLASLGILKGSNGQFRPFDFINRAEFTAMCVRFATKEADTVGKEFADVSSTFWAHDEIAKAAALNWVIGFPDGYFKPADGMTRAHAVTLINRVLGRPGDLSAIQAGQGVSFKDVKPTFWGYTAITESATPHSYTMDDVTFTETWAKG